MGIKAGFGHVGFGRSAFGQGTPEYESRFSISDPVDGETGVSEYRATIQFSLYCFSSRLQWESGSESLIEISEDGGSSYASAYENGSFVSPYNGVYSRIDPQQSDPQVFEVVFHRSTGLWADGQEIRVRVTMEDGYGDAATKEIPVEW